MYNKIVTYSDLIYFVMSQHAVHANSPAAWLPYSGLDQLTTLLQENTMKFKLSEVYLHQIQGVNLPLE